MRYTKQRAPGRGPGVLPRSALPAPADALCGAVDAVRDVPASPSVAESASESAGEGRG